MPTVANTSSEPDVKSLLRLLIAGKLSTSEYAERLSHLHTPKPNHVPHSSVAPTVHFERILALRGGEHRNPFQPGEQWNMSHQKVLQQNNPRLASTLQAQALNRIDKDRTSAPLPDHLPNPWLHGKSYSLAQQIHIQNTNPLLAIQLQLDCQRIGQ